MGSKGGVFSTREWTWMDSSATSTPAGAFGAALSVPVAATTECGFSDEAASRAASGHSPDLATTCALPRLSRTVRNDMAPCERAAMTHPAIVTLSPAMPAPRSAV